MTDHRPYHSLESFRPRLVGEYLMTYLFNIIVMEKIHGSNVSIVGTRKDGKFTYQLGSRKRWVSEDENFNNFQALFKEHFQQIEDLFTEIAGDRTDCVIRLYGEVYGGQYGPDKVKGAFRTQSEPNYCAKNDFAFFDIAIDGDYMPILEMIEVTLKHGLKVPPVIFQGSMAEFLKEFKDVENFQSRVSEEFYGLENIDVSGKGAEGVTIRTINPNPGEDEGTILKWKKAWATENRRVNQMNPEKIDTNNKYENAILDMVNRMRIVSYASKIPEDELSNPRFISRHIGEMVEDTMKDAMEEFPPHENPQMKVKPIKRKVTQKLFPMFKDFLKDQERKNMTPEMRMQNLIVEGDKIAAEANILNMRLQKLHQRLAILG